MRRILDGGDSTIHRCIAVSRQGIARTRSDFFLLSVLTAQSEWEQLEPDSSGSFILDACKYFMCHSLKRALIRSPRSQLQPGVARSLHEPSQPGGIQRSPRHVAGMHVLRDLLLKAKTLQASKAGSGTAPDAPS
jgi:hypothetical protein